MFSEPDNSGIIFSGIILKCVGGLYTCLEDGSGRCFTCTARGIFRKNEISPVAGDHITFSALPDGDGRIEDVLPRRNILIRPPIANVNLLVIVVSSVSPSPNPLIIDKMIAVAENVDMEPVIVFNKSDLCSDSGLENIYREAGFDTFIVSAKTGDGIVDLSKRLDGFFAAFTGNSGVGKSSVLNALDVRFALETGDISKKLGRGRHTTRVVELFPREGGGFLADTPGFSSLDTARVLPVDLNRLPELFREFSDFLPDCRFRSCTHRRETGCAVTAAMDAGRISSQRYNSYLSIYEELEAAKKW